MGVGAQTRARAVLHPGHEQARVTEQYSKYLLLTRWSEQESLAYFMGSILKRAPGKAKYELTVGILLSSP